MIDWLFPSEPLDKRLKVSLDFNHKILEYGANNLYPQRMEQIRLRSPLLVSATQVLEDFMNGSGWELNNEIILNQANQTGRDLLNLVSMDFSRYHGFALHINFDGVGNIIEIQHIPFQYARLGIPDENGIVTTVVVSNNWEEDSDKQEGGGLTRTQWYPIFNASKAAEETITVPQPKGQVLYYTGQERWKYPLATYDAIQDTGRTDAAIQKYEESNTNKGFHGATIFRYPGKFESKTQQGRVTSELRKMMGPENPGITLIQVDEDFTGTLMEQIPSSNDDALFTTTLTSTLERTLYHYNIPPALFGISPAGGVFTQLAYQESFIVYNVRTRNKRDELSRVFNRLAAMWHQQSFTFGRIRENEFEVQSEANERVANRLTGPTTEQLDQGAVQIAAENQENKVKSTLKPTKIIDSGSNI